MKLDSLIEFNLRHKILSPIVLGISYSIIIRHILNSFTHGEFEKIYSIFDTEEQLVLPLGAIAFQYGINSLLTRAKSPRLINLTKMTIYSFVSLYAQLRKNSELYETYYAKERVVYDLDDLQDSEVYKLIRRREFGAAMELSLAHIDKEPKNKDDIINITLGAPIAYILEYSLARYHKNVEALLGLAVKDYTLREFQRLEEKTLPALQELEPDNLELKVIRAMFLSLIESPKATKTWEKIEQSCEQKPLGTSRNSVRELTDNKYLQGTIIIKEGPELKTEYEVLKQAYKEIPEAHLYFPRPLALHSNKLVTKRKSAKSLEETLVSSQEEVNKAMQTLARLHSLPPTNLKIYDPKATIERRFLKRFEENEEFKRAYEEFFDVRYPRDTYVTCHGDFYPTNVLQGGIIIDLEKACEGLALLDLTNFLIAPQFKNINKPEAMEAYKEIRSFQDKGRQFFEVHNAICQVGSFHHQKSPKVRYFLELAREKLKDMGENRLRNSLNFVEPYFL